MDMVIAASLVTSGLMIGGAAIASGLGVSRVGASLIDGVARQPHMADKLQVKAFLMAGTLDAIPMIAVGIGVMLLFANPYL
ncbi:MAG: F0F1 ATP synthase subunit C [Moraxellaceae bacterium]|nr:MAG: F0F1 ATP synthase subunit C [Moraxellaceae bacterium]